MMDSIMFFIFNPSFYHYLGTEKPQNIVYQRYIRVMDRVLLVHLSRI